MRSLLLFLPFLAYGQSLTGLWDATVMTDGMSVPFLMKVNQQGAKVTATLFDGPIEYPSDEGTFEGGKLHAHWNIYNANLDATFDGTALQGKYITRRSNTKLLTKEISAKRASVQKSDPHPAQIAGKWTLKADDNDPKKVWTVVIEQSNDHVSGAIQRLDGDSGTLTGTIRDGKLVMSHFSGIRPAVLRGTVLKDGSLKIIFDDKDPMVGFRNEVAREKGVAPADPKSFTSVKDPKEPFPFAFPDLTGKIVSNTDARFKDKVVLVNITGSWCPNCNDDAPVLEALYKKYRSQGLEIVGLSFESGDIEYDRDRVKQFIARNGVTYPILIAGTVDNIAEKMPFVVNFVGYPTTFFLGRDGRVQVIHDGFAGVGTGDAHTELKVEIEKLVQELLKKRG